MPTLRTPRKYVFVVGGNGEFPTDMLKHDNSVAFSAADQSIIDARLDRDSAASLWDDKTKHLKANRVFLVTTTPRLLTPKRWQSFGWKIVELPRRIDKMLK